MFATTSRARQHQRESTPPPGTDSCYGVRSLNGSVSWDGGSDEREQEQDPERSDRDPVHMEGTDEDNETQSTLVPSTTIIPPSPDDTLHPLSHHDDDDPLPENPSEPSSPASFTSMPSYVASTSSVSRTSSPIGSAADFARHVGAGSEDLVLPMLRLPSTSLHMSLRKWEGEGEVSGLKVVLAGSHAATQKVLRTLRERCELAEMGRTGEVGVIRAGRVVMMLSTGLPGDQVSRGSEHQV